MNEPTAPTTPSADAADADTAGTDRAPDLPLPGFDGQDVRFERTIRASASRLTSRTRARVRAVDVLFEADARRLPLEDVLEQRQQRTAAQSELPLRASQLVRLAATHLEEIDEQIRTNSRDWPLERMPAVDRAVVRLGAAEALFEAEAPQRGMVIGEYTKIAELLSTEDSPRFVNGLLQRLVDIRGLLGD